MTSHVDRLKLYHQKNEPVVKSNPDHESGHVRVHPFPNDHVPLQTTRCSFRPEFHNVLAINQCKEYQLISSGELQHCLKLGKVHFCKDRQTLKTNFPEILPGSSLRQKF